MPSGRKPGTPKTGGRVAGTPNKATATVIALIDGLCGPGAEECLKKLVVLALSPHDNPQVRLAALKTLIEYRYGKPREMVEVTGAEGGPLVFTWQRS